MEQQSENNAVPVESESAPVRPGTLLREARERLGLSVADAAAQTKLAPRQIEALEADDYRYLPEMAFVRGFVRSYAKVLHLDAQPVLDALPQGKPISTQVSPASVEVPFPDARSPQLQNLIWLGAALFLSVVVVAVAVWNFTSPSSKEEPEEKSPVETVVPLPAEMHVIPASAVAEAAASSVEPVVAPVPAIKQAANPVTVKPLPASAVVATKPAAAPVAAKPVPAPAVPASKPVAPAVTSAATPAVKLAVPAVPAAKPAPVAATLVPVPAVPATKPVSPAVTSAAVPAVKPTVPAAPAVKSPVPVATPATTSQPVVSNQPANLRLTFGEESWTEVRDKNGNIVSSQLNPAGSELRLSGQGPYTLVVGRASSARLTYKGKAIDLKPSTNATSDVARVTLE